LTTHSFLLKITSQPALHSFVTEMREWFFIPGRIYPSFAGDGTLCKGSLHLCDDKSLLLSGKMTLIWWWSTTFLMTV
jgi:hypothetical protein